MKYALFEIKKNKVEQWQNWCYKLSTDFKLEAENSLKEENYLFEGWLIFNIGEDFYTIGFGEEKEEGAKPATDSFLNKEHKRNKEECLELISKNDGIFFSNFN
jgi:hypothetical protein